MITAIIFLSIETVGKLCIIQFGKSPVYWKILYFQYPEYFLT